MREDALGLLAEVSYLWSLMSLFTAVSGLQNQLGRDRLMVLDWTLQASSVQSVTNMINISIECLASLFLVCWRSKLLQSQQDYVQACNLYSTVE